MPTRELMREDVKDRLHGCWLGQQIGATLGTPVDGRTTPAGLRFYDPKPGQATASQDIDFQLAWLDLLRIGGPHITSDDLAEQWESHLAYTFDELGWAGWNIRRGLLPPLSGAFNNWFRTSSGGMGRSLLWAMAAPGAPQAAVELAWQDAVLDHSGEGLWAAMFWAAVGSAAFVVRDVPGLLEIGLAMIPSTCRTAGAVRAARDRFRIGQTPLQMRDAVFAAAGSGNYTDAAQNSGLVAMGLLFGKGDFGATVTSTVNAGLNARVNGTLAAGVAGIMCGRTGIPQEWAEPIGDVVIFGWGLRDLEVDRTTTDLAAHTLEAAEAMLAARDADVRIVDLASEMSAESSSGSSQGTAGTQGTEGSATLVRSADNVERSDENLLVGDRARFLEIEPAPAASAASAAPEVTEAAPAADVPVADSPLTDTPTPKAIGLPAPQEEHVASSDTAMVAPPLPTESTPAAAIAVDIPVEAAANVGADTPAMDPAVAPAPTEEPAPAPDLADVFEPSPTPVIAAAPSPVVELRANDRAKELLVRSATTAVCHVGDFEFTVDYGENGPVLLPGAATNFTVAVRNSGETDFVGGISLSTPPGWQVAVPGAQAQRQMIAAGRMARFGFVMRAPDEAPLAGVNSVQVVLSPANESPITCDLTFLGGSCWMFTGPFANNDEAGYDKVFEVEDKPGLENKYLGRNGGMVGWQRMAFRENVMDLEAFFGGVSGVAYAVTTLHFPVQTDARLVIHSNDGVHVWLNNQRILRRHAHEPFRPTVSQSRNMVDVTFKPGANKVMLKIVRCRESLQFAFLATDRNGLPLEDLGNTKWETGP